MSAMSSHGQQRKTMTGTILIPTGLKTFPSTKRILGVSWAFSGL